MFIKVVTVVFDESQKLFIENDEPTYYNVNTIFKVEEGELFVIDFIDGEHIFVKRQREGNFPDCVEVR